MHRRHLVLDVAPADDPFDDVRTLLEQGLGKVSFFVDDITAPAPDLTHYAFLQSDGSARVVLVADARTPAHYLVLEAQDAGRLGQLSIALTNRLPVLSFEQLRAASVGHRTAPGSLVRLALGSPAAADSDARQLIERALTDEDLAVRWAAVEAASLTQWPELLGPLQRARERESDPELFRFTADALAMTESARRSVDSALGPDRGDWDQEGDEQSNDQG